jgi:hypothetical protein
VTAVEETAMKGERQAVLLALLTAISNIRSDQFVSALEMAEREGAPKDLLDGIQAKQRPADR